MTAARRDEVLRAAADLFAEYGFHGVGMRAIGDAAGMRGASLYHYFPSKIDILHEVTVGLMKDFIDSQLADVDPCPTHTDRIRSMAVNHVLHLHRNRTAQIVGMREVQVLSLHRPAAHRELTELAGRYRSALEDLISAGVAAADFACPDPHATARAIVGILNSVNDWYRSERDGEIENVASTYANLVVRQILRSTVDRDRSV